MDLFNVVINKSIFVKVEMESCQCSLLDIFFLHCCMWSLAALMPGIYWTTDVEMNGSVRYKRD